MNERLIGALCARSGRLDRWCREALEMNGVDTIELTPQPNIAPAPGFGLSFRGWSPSLHGVWIHTLHALPRDADDEDQAIEALKEELADIARHQRRRADDAAELGHGRPLRKGMVDHLQVDRAIAAIYKSAGEDRDLTEFVRSTIGALHREMNTHRGGRTFGRPGQMVGESDQSDGTTVRYVAPQVKIYATAGRWPAIFTGHHLRLPTDRLPETVLAGLVDKPLSTLVRIHEDLDGRIIRMAENDERSASRTVLIGLDQHLEPLAKQT